MSSTHPVGFMRCELRTKGEAREVLHRPRTWPAAPGFKDAVSSNSMRAATHAAGLVPMQARPRAVALHCNVAVLQIDAKCLEALGIKHNMLDGAAQ